MPIKTPSPPKLRRYRSLMQPPYREPPESPSPPKLRPYRGLLAPPYKTLTRPPYKPYAAHTAPVTKT
jgi:hypothetical protein